MEQCPICQSYLDLRGYCPKGCDLSVPVEGYDNDKSVKAKEQKFFPIEPDN